MDTLQKELFDAIEEGEIYTVTQLLASGADVNKYNENGDTPLTKAIENHDVSMVQHLLEEGRADPNLADKFHRVPLIVAFDKYLEVGEMEEIVKHLLKAGANVDYSYLTEDSPIDTIKKRMGNAEYNFNQYKTLYDRLFEKSHGKKRVRRMPSPQSSNSSSSSSSSSSMQMQTKRRKMFRPSLQKSEPRSELEKLIDSFDSAMKIK